MTRAAIVAAFFIAAVPLAAWADADAPAAVTSAVPAEAPKIIVLDLTPAGGVDPSIAGALSESIAGEVGARGYYQAIASREVQTLVGMERQKELLGCSEESKSCMAELSGALGARFVLSGTLARLGEAYQLTLQTLDTQKAQTVGRSTRLAKDLGTLRALVPVAVAEATGTPPPPAPSRLAQYALIGVGGLAIVGGGIVGQSALSREAALQSELDRGQRFPGTLDTFASYQAQQKSLSTQKLLSLTSLAAGAALVVTGVLTLPADSGSAVQSASLVPSGNGIALVGTWK